MANGVTYGIAFPFMDSREGKFLELTQTTDEEIRTDLVHLILSRKGSRYFLPDFGTRLYEFIFEPMDGPTFSDIQAEIKDAVDQYMPGLTLNEVSIKPASEDEPENENNIYQVPGLETKEHTAKVRIDYTINDSAFSSSDFIIINI